jgi:hypothetical protein
MGMLQGASSLDHGDAYDCFLAEIQIAVAVEAVQQVFLKGNALAEESPAHIGVHDCAEGVTKQQLRPNSPVEPSEISGMAEFAVNARGDEAVALIMGGHDLMRKVFPTLPHANTTHTLSGHEYA